MLHSLGLHPLHNCAFEPIESVHKGASLAIFLLLESHGYGSTHILTMKDQPTRLILLSQELSLEDYILKLAHHVLIFFAILILTVLILPILQGHRVEFVAELVQSVVDVVEGLPGLRLRLEGRAGRMA